VDQIAAENQREAIEKRFGIKIGIEFLIAIVGQQQQSRYECRPVVSKDVLNCLVKKSRGNEIEEELDKDHKEKAEVEFNGKRDQEDLNDVEPKVGGFGRTCCQKESGLVDIFGRFVLEINASVEEQKGVQQQPKYEQDHFQSADPV
jgi:hypothetical protein